MEQSRLSRRKFMQLGFAVVGGAAVSPVMGIVDPLNALHRTHQIGVMLPQGKRMPLAGANLLDGLKLAFADQEMRVTLFSESTGIDQDSAYRAAESLLKSGVKIVVGMVSTAHVEALQPLFEAYDATLIVATPGENSVDQSHANIFYNSLNYWQSAHTAGQWAVQHYGARGMLLASFYESGFDATYAFEKGVHAAGGEIAGSHVTHFNAAQNGLAAAIAAIRDTQPDFVYAAYSGTQAAEFIAAYDAAALPFPLVTSAFAGDSGARAAMCVSTWSQSDENAAFAQQFRQSTGRGADAFAALGYETAQWIGGALLADYTGTFRDTLALTAVSGPRGALTFDARTRTLGSAINIIQDGAVIERLGFGDTHGVSLNLALKTGWSFGYTAL